MNIPYLVTVFGPLKGHEPEPLDVGAAMFSDDPVAAFRRASSIVTFQSTIRYGAENVRTPEDLVALMLEIQSEYPGCSMVNITVLGSEQRTFPLPGRWAFFYEIPSQQPGTVDRAIGWLTTAPASDTNPGTDAAGMIARAQQAFGNHNNVPADQVVIIGIVPLPLIKTDETNHG